jgi:ferric-dicitrate binding protein FerR (iron transport regulator)
MMGKVDRKELAQTIEKKIAENAYNELLSEELAANRKTAGDWREMILAWVRTQHENCVAAIPGYDDTFITLKMKVDGKTVDVQVKLPTWLATVMQVLRQVYGMEIAREKFIELMSAAYAQNG